jgi:hypothetical protein
MFIPLLSHAQGFFRPVSADIFPKGTDRAMASVWLVRPYFNITALKITLTQPATVSPLASLGTGVSYSLFRDNAGEPYQVFAANLAVLFGTDVTAVSPLELSLAATVTGWQYLSVGAGYDFKNKNVFLLSSFSFNFNK